MIRESIEKGLKALVIAIIIVFIVIGAIAFALGKWVF